MYPVWPNLMSCRPAAHAPQLGSVAVNLHRPSAVGVLAITTVLLFASVRRILPRTAVFLAAPWARTLRDPAVIGAYLDPPASRLSTGRFGPGLEDHDRGLARPQRGVLVEILVVMGPARP